MIKLQQLKDNSEISNASEISMTDARRLLGMFVSTHKPSSVKHQFAMRKRMLWQQVPGKQFVALAVAIERRLEEAAIVLSRQTEKRINNPVYNNTRKNDKKTQTAKNDNLIDSGRQIITRMINHDGTMDESVRGELAAHLGDLGVDFNNVLYVLSRIPSPATEGIIADMESGDIFIESIDALLKKRRLTKDDKTALLKTGIRMGIDEAKGRELISLRLKEKGIIRNNSESMTHNNDENVIAHHGENAVGIREYLLDISQRFIQCAGVPIAAIAIFSILFVTLHSPDQIVNDTDQIVNIESVSRVENVTKVDNIQTEPAMMMKENENATNNDITRTER